VDNRLSSPTPPFGPEPAQYLTLREVASTLRVHPKTVERWAKKDETFPDIHLGPNTLRVDARLLERWVRARTAGQAMPKTCALDS
jgi:hypothetical protein